MAFAFESRWLRDWRPLHARSDASSQRPLTLQGPALLRRSVLPHLCGLSSRSSPVAPGLRDTGCSALPQGVLFEHTGLLACAPSCVVPFSTHLLECYPRPSDGLGEWSRALVKAEQTAGRDRSTSTVVAPCVLATQSLSEPRPRLWPGSPPLHSRFRGTRCLNVPDPCCSPRNHPRPRPVACHCLAPASLVA